MKLDFMEYIHTGWTGFIATAALAHSIYQGFATRNLSKELHNYTKEKDKLSAKPQLHFRDNIDGKPKKDYYIKIANKGEGTAHIHSISYFFDGKEVKKPDDFFSKATVDKNGNELNYSVGLKREELHFGDNVQLGASLISGEEKQTIHVEIIDYKDTPVAKANEDLQKKMTKIGIIFCYSSKYGDADQFNYQSKNVPKYDGKSIYSFCRTKHSDLDLKFPDDKY